SGTGRHVADQRQRGRAGEPGRRAERPVGQLDGDRGRPAGRADHPGHLTERRSSVIRLEGRSPWESTIARSAGKSSTSWPESRFLSAPPCLWSTPTSPSRSTPPSPPTSCLTGQPPAPVRCRTRPSSKASDQDLGTRKGGPRAALLAPRTEPRSTGGGDPGSSTRLLRRAGTGSR